MKTIFVPAIISQKDAFDAIKDDLGVCQCGIIFLRTTKRERVYCCNKCAAKFYMRKKRGQK